MKSESLHLIPKRMIAFLCAAVFIVVSFGCCFAFAPAAAYAAQQEPLVMLINGEAVNVDWEDNASVDALRKMAAKKTVKIKMSKYGGFEQYGEIGKTLPANDREITTSAGDIVLYEQDQMVVFYGSNTWEYTRLGKINKTKTELKKLLGGDDVTVVLRFRGAPGPASFSSVKAGNRKVMLKWKKVTSAAGYQIQYSTNSKFKANRKTIKVKKKGTVSKTVKGLKAGKRYYVRIRTYKTINGKTYYSKWSKGRSVKTK